MADTEDAGRPGAWIAIGVAIGVMGTAALTRYVESMLFDVRRTDWQSYTVAVVLLSTLAIAAAVIPAKVDPISALRCE